MNIIKLVKYLNQELLTRLSEEGKEDTQALDRLSNSLYELSEAAQYYNDMFLYELFDDMNYVIHETNMGARVKGEMMLSSIKVRVNELKENGSNG
jgi:hypothetical protein